MNQNERMLVEVNLQHRNAHRQHLSQTEPAYAPIPQNDVSITQNSFTDTSVNRSVSKHIALDVSSAPSRFKTKRSSTHEYDKSTSTQSQHTDAPLNPPHHRASEQWAQNSKQKGGHPHAELNSAGQIVKHHPSFIQSCRHALDGIIVCISTERNLKIMLVVACALQIICLITPWITTTLYLLVTLYSVIMLVLEMINTALESVVDLISPDYHPLAKRAKDIMAGAVSFFAVACIHLAIVGFVIPLFNLITHSS